MAVYGINRQATGSAGFAFWELRTASTDRAKVERIGIILRGAAALVMGLGRPGAIGVTPTSPVTWLALDPADPAGTVQTALAWATGPTVPANFFRRFQMNTNGEGLILTFPTRLIVAVSSSIVLWGIAQAVARDIQVFGEE
jgi:hypothetical protein